MFSVHVSITMDCGHHLENYPGACANRHGHTYTVTGIWKKHFLDRFGMALDMVLLKRALKNAVVDMDHHDLNKIRGLPTSTAENIAKLLFARLSAVHLSGPYLTRVEVLETPGCSVSYEPPKPVSIGRTGEALITKTEAEAEAEAEAEVAQTITEEDSKDVSDTENQ